MNRESSSTHLAGSELGELRHVCAFFNSDDEEYRVLLPFIKDGFNCGEKAVHVVKPDQRNDHLQRLTAAGIDTSEVEQRGQLELRVSTETYLREGHFDQDGMMALFEAMANKNTRSEFPSLRIVCRMDLTVGLESELEKVIEFESQVNDVWRRNNDPVVCTYHLSQFSGDAVIDIMRTHPMVIIGGVLFENPFFMPPEKFLQEFRNRTGRAGSLVATS